QNYGSSAIQATVSSGGYNFVPASGNLVVLANGAGCGPACAANGTTTLVMGGNNVNPFAAAPLVMTNATNQSFYLLGFDFGEFIQGGRPENATTLKVLGNLFGGGTVSQIFNIDGINDGPGGGVDFQAANLLAFWGSSLLTSVEFSGFSGQLINQGFQLDNIIVDSNRVPEPVSLVLVSLGLLGLGFSRRNRTI
ncbi:MAG TPA: PEP-CTERM sorting domain-containing protein, partial [Rhodocyclaceae bacterium]|nr:PEP-CTERM sorting domain-containing protein [Rhodocyclaceae bacterium]